jgi:DNA-binding NtrC family response regulator
MMQSSTAYVLPSALPASADVIVGESRCVAEMRAIVNRVAPTSATILVRGETGTGKELVAKAIHRASGRSGPLVTLHCAAFPDTLLESELFGHEKGAFTGAVDRKLGHIEAAEGGTLLLDEIGDVTPATQVKLLRLVQEREFRRLGSSRSVRADVRFVAATHRNLEEMVKAGQFREDLFYRLNVVPIRVAPLRDRPADIELLARHFCRELALQAGRPAMRLSDAAVARLRLAAWPGNVRQLQNLIHRLVVLTPGDQIRAADVEAELSDQAPLITVEASESQGAGDDVMLLGEAVRRAEQAAIAAALRSTAGNRATFYNKLREHGIGDRVGGQHA